MHDAFSKGQYGFTTWTFWPGATNSYLIEGIEQVWLNGTTPEAYLDADGDAVRPGSEGRQGAAAAAADGLISRCGCSRFRRC